ncbi:OLC1v1011701C1 [Oldenlandia corymbosa var. corymbosa]|uniref:OLC1v1011701C1 n=1 Tax=Oldenlandia corymbosa var. corymbosa TaxID=529605 RepID=A0AAV1DU75_OLDCO|nr:OLC1v1011701C1 [Oldenlandia corymbosa var. corymbosa]
MNYSMDSILCDELLQEIFQRLPPPPASSAAAVCLVSKRWLRLLRSSISSLSLTFFDHHHPPTITILPSLSSFLSQHPYLSSLSLTTAATAAVPISADQLLLAASHSCTNLRALRLFTEPLSLFSLLSLSSSFLHLSSLTITIRRPLTFHQWVPLLRHLKHLSIYLAAANAAAGRRTQLVSEETFNYDDEAEVKLESLSLSGFQAGDRELSYFWRNCKLIKKLELQSCEGVGDNSSFLAFLKSLNNTTLQEVELRTCRTAVEGVLLKLSQNCVSLKSLLIYDGCSKQGLLQFVSEGRCFDIQKLDLRLPLDLSNEHLIAVSEKFRFLSSLRLQSCCLFNGEGLQAISKGVSSCELQELALVKCDVVERESGLLTLLGQNLKKLRKLDLSYNEMLVDKEVCSMLVSCGGHLNELKFRGCGKLTNAVLLSMAKNCLCLETLDIMNCCSIESESVEWFLKHCCSYLRELLVEDSKVSVFARIVASDKRIEVLG